ncbi:MAG: thioredoxin domain-containing protein [Thermoplasmata archaeon]|nr:thioredoxin domain-containing protein [Thermoplasmata archaeon]
MTPSEAAEGAVRATRLKEAASAYLRGAAEQPIDWHPWGPEPFQLAERLNRPILLDIGAVWCHWCHVMDEGTYADPEVARLLGMHFVPVKVDRDEHPEVDRRYQRQVAALTGQGGWPLTAFLTPKGDVFLGGTFFPPQDGMGRPGFRRVLKEVARIWREEPEKAIGNTRAIQESLDRIASHETDPDRRSLTAFRDAVLDQLQQGYDPVNGGFGFAPKFPHPTAVSFLLAHAYSHDDAMAAARARETLLRMADGGMYDHLGGGFHRYSVDEGWHVPHFEKMGADNAALLAAYSDGARRFGDARLVETVLGILGWVESTLADPKGGFGASQDADNAPGDDGGYFTWSRSEMKAALAPDELRLLSRFFGVGSDGRMPHDPEQNVLFRLLPLAEAAEGTGIAPEATAHVLARGMAKLRAVREQRPAPFVDRALYADINGSFIRGAALAGAFLGDARPIALARAAADRFLAAAYRPDQGVAHLLGPDGPTGFGHLEDQALFAFGLTELAGATALPEYARTAAALLELVHREFAGDGGLLQDLAPRIYDGPKIGSVDRASFPLEDNPHLSANAAVAIAEVRLAGLIGDDALRQRARRLMEAIVPRVHGAGLFAAGSAWAVELGDTLPARIVVEGTGPAADALLRTARTAWHPNLWVFRGTPPAPFSLPDEFGGAADRPPARALVCFGDRCLAPVTDAEALGPLVRSSGRSASA